MTNIDLFIPIESTGRWNAITKFPALALQTYKAICTNQNYVDIAYPHHGSALGETVYRMRPQELTTLQKAVAILALPIAGAAAPTAAVFSSISMMAMSLANRTLNAYPLDDPARLQALHADLEAVQARYNRAIAVYNGIPEERVQEHMNAHLLVLYGKVKLTFAQLALARAESAIMAPQAFVTQADDMVQYHERLHRIACQDLRRAHGMPEEINDTQKYILLLCLQEWCEQSLPRFQAMNRHNFDHAIGLLRQVGEFTERDQQFWIAHGCNVEEMEALRALFQTPNPEGPYSAANPRGLNLTAKNGGDTQVTREATLVYIEELLRRPPETAEAAAV